jgi:hypothetical protein
MKMSVAISRSGHFVDVDQLDVGGGADCVCLFCRKRVKAKTSDIQHFWHDADGGCSWSPEAELYIQTKRYLASRTTIPVPIGIVEKSIKDISYQNAEIEVRSSGSRYDADVYAIIKGEPLHFEVSVVNPSEPGKAKHYKSLRLNAVEINMQGYFARFQEITPDNIKTFIAENAHEHRWLSINPNGHLGREFYMHYCQVIADRGAKLKNIDLTYKERIESLERRELLLADALVDLKRAASSYSSASKHIKVLTEALRPLARKHGIPWPIDDECEQILKQAGNSNILMAAIGEIEGK